MSDELYFDVELKKCLNTAAFSDDLWDWWYQRIHQAHDASVDRVTGTQRAENAKLRELASILCFCMQVHAQCDDCKLNGAKGEFAHDPLCACDGLHEILRELGIEVD